METLDRRAILAGGAAALMVPVGAGLAKLGAPLSGASGATGTASAAAALPTTDLGAYLRIDGANDVTLLIGATEMGQGIMTGLAQLIAEELMLDWTQVKVEHADAFAGQPNPFANPLFRAQLTGGSTSMRGWYTPLRKAAAVARELLLAAAETLTPGGGWSLAPGGKATNGVKTYRFSELVETAAGLPAPASPALATTRNVIGKPMARTDIPAKVDGSAVFGSDVQVPGMVFASVVHCPTLGGTVASLPSKPSGALAMVDLGNAVAVVANDTWSAMRMAESLASKIRWNLPADTSSRDSTSIMANARALATSTSAAPRIYETTGGVDPAIALADAAVRLDATYELPYLAHACMEVLNCTAVVTADSAEVWAPTQGQQLCIPTVMAITGLPATAIKVHTTFLGGGLGRKIEQDYVGQAVKVAKAIGKPVKLTWSRKQDFQNDMYRPCAVIRVQAGLDANRNLSAMIYRNVSPSINIQRNTKPGNNPEDTGAVAGAQGLPYAIANRRIEFVPLPADIPLGYWRSVGESYNTFAVESAIDELAGALGADPLAFRRAALAGDPRAVGVIDAVDALSGWSTSSPRSGRARGVAFLKGFGSYIAMVAEVSQSSGKMRLNTLYCAIDCGVAVNPDQIEAQIQGGVIHGLSAAMWGQVLFAGGKANVTNFNNYRLAKAGDVPDIKVSIVASEAAPGGVGETGVPCVAPAMANAYAKLTGQRLRKLPFYPGATMGGL
ncbi:MAG: molybdopterin-dependent oxidoreductase [Phenylobacterium sp.]|uniref:xanthine dehydrogenase family protein molybdopterin-binding subunit n=1 Tax=Phenylobacterium sp. TaxID=1871053 RepID=UPI0025E37585|nr:molybdopterin cofactor-binding domain-containing protein [Phenylobacterium sp.]MBI1198080.1 molybdopterin-dependent oxidoreductase [Phenylobacterium sp.]